MTIEKYIGNESASIIFDPVPSYNGEWMFSLENLINNSLQVDGQNLFLNFVKKTFYEPMFQIFNDPIIANLQIAMISKPKENRVGRCLRYAKADFYVLLCDLLNQHLDNYGKSKEEQNKFLQDMVDKLQISNDEANIAFSESFKDKANKLQDLMQKEINSEYFDAAMQDYGLYKKSGDFANYLKIMHNLCTNIQTGILKLGDFFDHDLDYNALYHCFDADTFYLLFAKILYEQNLKKEEEAGGLDNSYVYLYNYKDLLEKVEKDNHKYQERILYSLPSGKKVRYTHFQFKEDIKELFKRHPEAKDIKLPSLQGNEDKYKDISLMEKILLIYNEETKANWEFLPEGIKILQNETVAADPLESVKNNLPKDNDALIREVNMRIEILENSGYIGTPIKGLNAFTGYYCFIYPNGSVIIEKFWANENDFQPAQYNATYTMNIDNFIEMSKFEKINLNEYIKTMSNTGVKRIFHTTINRWQRNLYNEINGTYRLEDAINYIMDLKNKEQNR